METIKSFIWRVTYDPFSQIIVCVSLPVIFPGSGITYIEVSCMVLCVILWWAFQAAAYYMGWSSHYFEEHET